MRVVGCVLVLSLTGCRVPYHGSDGSEESESGQTNSSSESVGSTESEDSESGESGETNDVPADVGDPENWAIEMTGEQVVETEMSAVTSLGEDFTVELWIRTGPQTTGFLFDTRTVACCPTGWMVYQDAGAWTPTKDLVTFIDYGAPDNMSWNYVSGPNLAELSPGWHHVAIVGTEGQVRFFVDGSVHAPDAFAPRDHPPGPLRIGRSKNGDFPLLDAAIDDLRVSSIARYVEPFVPEEVLSEDSYTVALWPFDEGDGSSSADTVSGLELGFSGTNWVTR